VSSRSHEGNRPRGVNSREPDMACPAAHPRFLSGPTGEKKERKGPVLSLILFFLLLTIRRSYDGTKVPSHARDPRQLRRNFDPAWRRIARPDEEASHQS